MSGTHGSAVKEPQANGGPPNTAPTPHRTGPATVYDLAPPSDKRSQIWRVPQLTWEGLQLVWHASPRLLLATMALNIGSAVAIGFQLLLAREVLGDMIDVGGSGAATSTLLVSFGALIAATVALGTFGALTTHVQRLLTEIVAQHAMGRILDVAVDVDLQAFEDPAFHDQLQRARTSGTYRSIEVVNSINTLLSGAVLSLGIAAALFLLEPLLLLFIALAAVPMLLATIHNSRASYTFEYGMTPESRERAYVYELLTEREPAAEVRLFDAGSPLRARYEVLTKERLRLMRQFLRGRLTVSLIGTIAGALGTAGALAALAVLLSTDKIDVATAVTAGFAMQQLSMRMVMITGSIGKLIESGMFVDDYNAFLQLAERRLPDAGEDAPTPRRRPFGGVALERVSFTYPSTSRPVLEDIDLHVDPGEIVALVGENGSGKTTLVKLICQLYRPTNGLVTWNGVDASTLPPGEIRDDMTVIFQDFIKYHLTARENIALGRPTQEAADGDVLAAARQAGAHDFLERLPQGYDTRLGRQFYGGHELSVGQWQRLALSRAFYRGGGFLILDEPTAALDPRAEADLFTQMRNLAEGRSVLMISHRFSSVRSADRIYVVEHGRISETGSHAELMARGGQYAELFELQAAAYLGE